MAKEIIKVGLEIESNTSKLKATDKVLQSIDTSLGSINDSSMSGLTSSINKATKSLVNFESRIKSAAKGNNVSGLTKQYAQLKKTIAQATNESIEFSMKGVDTTKQDKELDAMRKRLAKINSELKDVTKMKLSNLQSQLNSSSNSANKAAKNINELHRVATSLSKTNIGKSLNTASSNKYINSTITKLRKLRSTMNNITNKPVNVKVKSSGIGKTSTSSAKVGGSSKFTNGNSDSIKQSLASGTKSVGSFMGSLGSGFKSVTSGWGSRLNNIFNGASNNAINSFSNLGAYVSIGGIALLGKSMIDLSSDMTEVQNVTDTVFGSSSGEIDAFCQNASKQFGETELAAKTMIGQFGGMLTGSGIVGQASVDMSKNLTALSGDVASFYNMSQEAASTKLQSGLSGEVEAMRSFGVMMTVANLEAYRLSQGITTSYDSMDQAAKTTLRYNYMLQQLKNSQGDFQKTQGSWANQTRILTNNFKLLGSYIGGALISQLLPVITVFNTILDRAVSMAAILAKVFHFDTASIGDIIGANKGVADTASSTEDLATSNDNAAATSAKLAKQTKKSTAETKKNAKETKKAASDNLQSFDKLNKLAGKATSSKSKSDTSPSTGNTSPSTGGVGNASIIPYSYIGDTPSKEDKKKKSKLEKFFESIYDMIKAKDFKGLGKLVASGINSMINSMLKPFRSNIAQKKVESFFKGISDGINGFVDGIDTKAIGELFGELTNTVVLGIDTLITSINWGKMSSNLASGLNSLIKKIDSSKIGKSLADLVNAGFQSMLSFFSKLDSYGIGKKIASLLSSFIKNANAKKIGKGIASLLKAGIDASYGLITNIDFSKLAGKVAKSINYALADLGKVDKKTGLTGWQKFGKSIGKTISGFADFIVTALKKLDKKKLKKGFEDALSSAVNELDVNVAKVTLAVAAFALTGLGFSLLKAALIKKFAAMFLDVGVAIKPMVTGLSSSISGGMALLGDMELLGAATAAEIGAALFLPIAVAVAAAIFGWEVSKLFRDKLQKALNPKMSQYSYDFKFSDLFTYSPSEWAKGFEGMFNDMGKPLQDLINKFKKKHKNGSGAGRKLKTTDTVAKTKADPDKYTSLKDTYGNKTTKSTKAVSLKDRVAAKKKEDAAKKRSEAARKKKESEKKSSTIKNDKKLEINIGKVTTKKESSSTTSAPVSASGSTKKSSNLTATSGSANVYSAVGAQSNLQPVLTAIDGVTSAVNGVASIMSRKASTTTKVAKKGKASKSSSSSGVAKKGLDSFNTVAEGSTGTTAAPPTAEAHVTKKTLIEDKKRIAKLEKKAKKARDKAEASKLAAEEAKQAIKDAKTPAEKKAAIKAYKKAKAKARKDDKAADKLEEQLADAKKDYKDDKKEYNEAKKKKKDNQSKPKKTKPFSQSGAVKTLTNSTNNATITSNEALSKFEDFNASLVQQLADSGTVSTDQPTVDFTSTDGILTGIYDTMVFNDSNRTILDNQNALNTQVMMNAGMQQSTTVLNAMQTTLSNIQSTIVLATDSTGVKLDTIANKTVKLHITNNIGNKKLNSHIIDVVKEAHITK